MDQVYNETIKNIKSGVFDTSIDTIKHFYAYKIAHIIDVPVSDISYPKTVKYTGDDSDDEISELCDKLIRSNRDTIFYKTMTASSDEDDIVPLLPELRQTIDKMTTKTIVETVVHPLVRQKRKKKK